MIPTFQMHTPRGFAFPASLFSFSEEFFLVDSPDSNRRDPTGLPPEGLVQGIAAMGGETICVEDSTIGRVTSMRLAIATT